LETGLSEREFQFTVPNEKIWEQDKSMRHAYEINYSQLNFTGVSNTASITVLENETLISTIQRFNTSYNKTYSL
jgi:hypothetical protein